MKRRDRWPASTSVWERSSTRAPEIPREARLRAHERSEYLPKLRIPR